MRSLRQRQRREGVGGARGAEQSLGRHRFGGYYTEATWP